MKMLLILWAISLAECGKLDRTYLPPPGSIAAGGHPGDLNIPSEFSKDKYYSTLEPRRDTITTDISITSKYPNIALGINRQAPSVTFDPKFVTDQPKISVSKNNYNIPTTTIPYDLTQPFSSIETYHTTDGTITKISQSYSPRIPTFEPNLSYDQYLIQQNIKPNKYLQSIPMVDSGNPLTNLPNENIVQASIDFPSKASFRNNVNKYVAGQPVKSDSPESQLANVPLISTDLTSHNLSKIEYPTIQYDSDFNGTPEITISPVNSSYPEKYTNRQTFQTYSTQKVPTFFYGTNVNSQDIDNSGEVGRNYTLASSQSISGVSAINENIPPQRIQADGDRNAVVLDYENILTPEGYTYSFNTSNGIHVDESGTAIDGVKARGSYTFTGDNGKVYSVEYTADENGFLPRGDHLPTSPPIPEAILRGIEQAEKNKKIGIINDGSYDDAKYGHGRYQGIMGRKPLTKYYDDITNESSIKANEKESKTKSFEKDDSSENSGEIFDSTNHELDVKLNTPTKSEMIKGFKNNAYKTELDNRPKGNTLLSFDDGYDKNKSINERRNKFRGHLINVTTTDKELSSNNVQNSDILNPTGYAITSQKENNAGDFNQRFNSGYDYTRPQTTFNNNFSSKTINYEPNMVDKTNNERMISKSFTTPNVSFNFKTRKPVTKSQTFDNPIMTFDNANSIEMQTSKLGVTYPDTVYDAGVAQIKNEKNVAPERVSGSIEPKYASTTLRPFKYQSSYTSNGTGKQRNNIPSTTVESKYSISTTPLPFEISSPFTSSMSSISYFQTTPTIEQMTSTLRPPITSGRSPSGNTSGPSGYTGQILGQDMGDSKKATVKPGFQGRSNNNITPAGFSDNVKPKFGVLTDPRFQNVRVSSGPENFGRQSSIEKAIGEDFSGPKQQQRFDPKYGYYY